MPEPKDNVVRAVVYATDEGVEGWWKIDAIDHGDTVELVLTWEVKPGVEGRLPGKSLVMLKEFFTVESDPTKDYELRCLGRVNFDNIDFVDESRGFNAFDDTSKLSKPPPDLEL